MGKKISELQESKQINGSDYLVAVIEGQTNKIKYQSFLKEVQEDQKRVFYLTMDTEWIADTDVFKKVVVIAEITENDIVKIYQFGQMIWKQDCWRKKSMTKLVWCIAKMVASS